MPCCSTYCVQIINQQFDVVRALVFRPDVPTPHGHGWRLADGELKIHWMNQQPAPMELLELVSCGCKTGCLSRRCSCAKVNLPCAPACSCTNCENRREIGGSAENIPSQPSVDEEEEEEVDDVDQ